MSKMFLACFLILSFISPALAYDDNFKPYVGVTLGTALTSVNKLSDSSGSLDTDFEPGYMVGLTTGVAFKTDAVSNIDRVRAEAEIGYRSNHLKSMKNAQGQSVDMSGDVSVTNFMFNIYLESISLISRDIPINIFLTAGAGVAIASISSISYQGATLVNSASDTQFAYQGGLGVGYELSKNITVDVAYKYMGTTTLKFEGVEADYGSHNIILGARYSFK